LAPAAAWIALAQQAQQPRKVDDAALKNAAQTGEEWIAYNLGWSEQRFSRLDQINASNVNRLGLAWYSDIPAAPGNPQNRQEATPLVYNGIVYSITPWSVVYAVDARTGKEMWRSDPEVNQQVWQSRMCCGVVNRGIALYQDKIFAPVVDGRWIWLLAKSPGRRASPPQTCRTQSPWRRASSRAAK
jgi:glucose dehydrogenase